MGTSEEKSKPIVAVDGGVGAGIGDDVLITWAALANDIQGA